jgi:hypothetical protein
VIYRVCSCSTMPLVNVASAMVEGAELRLRQPVPPLRSYLGCFWSMATTPATRLRTLPDACVTLTVESTDSMESTDSNDSTDSSTSSH